jgi:F-type H+-transporting ATPase subunit b
MPQFDTSFLSSLIFWSVVSFGILLVLLYKYAFPVILGVLESREKSIRDSIEQAERIRKEAELLLADYQSRLSAAQQEAHTLLEQARLRAQQLLEENEKRLDRETERMLQEARQEIERQRLNAIKELREHVVDLVLQATEKILRRDITDQDHRQFVVETLAKIGEHQSKN